VVLRHIDIYIYMMMMMMMMMMMIRRSLMIEALTNGQGANDYEGGMIVGVHFRKNSNVYDDERYT
jgi:hypothetical protein